MGSSLSSHFSEIPTLEYPGGPLTAPPQSSSSQLELSTFTPDKSIQDIKPEDMITDGLKYVAMRAGDEYQPVFQSREISPCERGYWLLSCSEWSMAEKDEAWVILSRYITERIAGWGITCKRDPVFSEIRIDCWGCTVLHFYLILWVAGGKKAKYAGMTWTAEDGEVVVRMRDHPLPWEARAGI